jgi:hypothetical protein
VRETVFSSEIYEKTTAKPRQDSVTAIPIETDIVDCGDINVTYDLMEGAALDSGLVVKACKGGSSDPDTASLASSSCHSSADLSSLGGAIQKNVIGGVTIAEYEGSPRRYRPRKQDLEGGKRAAASSSKRRAGHNSSASAAAGAGKVPGFPQRVLPPTSTAAATTANDVVPAPATASSSSSSSPASNSSAAQKGMQRHHHQELSEKEEASSPPPHAPTATDVLVQFDEVLQEEEDDSSSRHEQEQTVISEPPSLPPAVSVRSVKDGGYDYQYEFSETRKVLDEFFTDPMSNMEDVGAAVDLTMASSSRRIVAPEENFMDLNYTLTRRSANGSSRLNGNAAVAANAAAAASQQQEHHLHQQHQQQVVANHAHEAEESDLLQLHHPQVGLSPLDQHPPTMVNRAAVAASSSSDVTISTSSSVTTGGRSNGTDTGYATLNSPDSIRHNLAPQPQQHHQIQQSLPKSSRVAPPQRGAQQQQQLQQQHVEFSQVAQTVSSSDVTLTASAASVIVIPPSTAALTPSSVAAAPGLVAPGVDCSRNFTLSPETTDCDSADLESEVSINEGSFHSSGPRMHTSMPVLEDGLSSGHASDLEEDVVYSR